MKFYRLERLVARYLFDPELNLPGYQIVRDLDRAEAFPDNCHLIPAASFLMLTG